MGFVVPTYRPPLAHCAGVAKNGRDTNARETTGPPQSNFGVIWKLGRNAKKGTPSAYRVVVQRQQVTGEANPNAELPYELRLRDFEMAMQDVYDFLFDVNQLLLGKGLHRLDDMLRPAAMSGMLSDMLTASMAKHSRTLVENRHFNGHPDLIVQGRYPQNSVRAGEHGIEIKSTRKSGGAVDTHGARDQWMAVFVYKTDHVTEPAEEREAMRFTEVYLGRVIVADFRRNPRGELGTRTATLDRAGIRKLRANWIYRSQ
jgi:hypothetical protein